MANPSVRSAGATTGWSTANPVAVPKPAGLTVGDLMVLCVTSYNGTTSGYPSGWEPLGVSPSVASGDNVRAAWKIATADDVAASTFSVPNANSVQSMGMCWAVQDPGPIEFFFVGTGSAANPTVLNSGFTPYASGDLLLVFGGSEAAMGAFSTANNDPTWTEDVSRTNYSVAKGRHASYGTGATGNLSCAINDADGKAAFACVAVQPAGVAGRALLRSLTNSAQVGASFTTSPTSFISGCWSIYTNQMLVEFRTQFIPDDSAVSDAVLSLYAEVIGGTAGVQQARAFDYGTADSGDARTYSQFAALPLVASIAESAITLNAFNALTSEPGFVGEVGKTGATRLILCTKHFAENTPPTGDESISWANMNEWNHLPTLLVTWGEAVSRAGCMQPRRGIW